MLKNFLSIYFIIAPLLLFSQQVQLNGLIVDSYKKPLPFVAVVLNGTNKGTLSDIDGKFELTVFPEELENGLLFNYTGYFPLSFDLKNKDLRQLLIVMKEKEIDLQEVTIMPGINPAHRIIEQAYKNRKKNNPEELNSFSYNTYNKMYITPEDGSKNDSLHLKDSLNKNKLNLYDKQYLFLTESVSERFFLYPDKNNESVLASKISGFQIPLFSILSTKMQSFSFYNDKVNVFDIDYLNPISKESYKNYHFILEDTLFQERDTVYMISFKAQKNKKFNALTGILFINTNGYAVQNVIAEPARQSNNIWVKIQQQYTLVNQTNWFPSQLNTDWKYMDTKVDKTNPQLRLKAISKSYIRNIRVNPDLSRIKFSEIELFMDPKVKQNINDTLNKYRVDPLTAKEIKTYKVIDSIGLAKHFDKRAQFMKAFIANQIKFGYTSIYLNEIMRYNEYEGYRLGLNLHSNEELSKFFNIGGYWAWGFKDRTQKFGADFQLNLWRKKELIWKNAFSNDVIESAGTSFFENKIGFNSSELYRTILISKMDRQINFQSEIQFRTLKYLKALFYLNHQQRWGNSGFLNAYPLSEYQTDTFYINETGIQLKFLYREKFMEFFGNKISMGSSAPVFYLNVSKGLKQDIFNYKGKLDYLRLDVKMDFKYTFKKGNSSKLQIQGGKIIGDVPYTLLYNNKGNFSNSFSVSAENTFETMLMNEFVSDRYFALFHAFNIGKIIRNNNYFNPTIEFANNVGFGACEQLINSSNLNALKSMDKGYFETGIRMQSMLVSGFSTLGLGVFYRYGPYQYNKASNNIALKLTIGFSF